MSDLYRCDGCDELFDPETDPDWQGDREQAVRFCGPCVKANRP